MHSRSASCARMTALAISAAAEQSRVGRVHHHRVDFEPGDVCDVNRNHVVTTVRGGSRGRIRHPDCVDLATGEGNAASLSSAPVRTHLEFVHPAHCQPPAGISDQTQAGERHRIVQQLHAVAATRSTANIDRGFTSPHTVTPGEQRRSQHHDTKEKTLQDTRPRCRTKARIQGDHSPLSCGNEHPSGLTTSRTERSPSRADAQPAFVTDLLLRTSIHSRGVGVLPRTTST